jgi:TRAP-type C4-dicarboxylate transport system permease small subunit
MVLLAAPICLARGMHLGVDYLTPKLPPPVRRIVRSAVFLLVGAFCLLLTFFSLRLLRAASLQVSPALGISMVWPYLSLPVSGALMSIEAGVLLWGAIRGRPPAEGRAT